MLAILTNDPEYWAVAASLNDRMFPANPFAPRPLRNAAVGAASR
jgi:hypothetical protein